MISRMIFSDIDDRRATSLTLMNSPMSIFPCPNYFRQSSFILESCSEYVGVCAQSPRLRSLMPTILC
jgi:hypothetical protein